MKKMMFTLMAMLTIAATASAMSYEQARNEALFLTDKMAYELNLTDAQYEAAYEINLDYLMGVTSQYDVFGPYWERRNLDLSYILFSWQWDLFRAATYFYRPLYWNAGFWHFGIYARYPHRDYFYFGRPHFYASYRGGHSWRMNGGRSFYEGRRDFYRPQGHNRDNHFGMRNGWDRGDYRGGHPGGGSSTRHTGSHDMSRGNQMDNQHNGGIRSGGTRQGSFGGSRTGGGTFEPRHNDNGKTRVAPSVQRSETMRSTAPRSVEQRPSTAPAQRSSSVQRSATPSQRSGSVGSFGGSHSGSSSSGVRSSSPTRSSSGSSSGMRSGSHSSGSHSSGSHSSGSHSGSRGGSFGGSRR